tara:strand:+ start:353 stop:841 length:489 start_codon:yes stop_codon:yes gene_type:complete
MYICICNSVKEGDYERYNLIGTSCGRCAKDEINYEKGENIMSEDKKQREVEVEESAEYDNYLGDVDDSSLPTTLDGFMGEGKTGINTEVDIDGWRSHWKQMPAYTQEPNEPFKKVIMAFRTKEDYEEFQNLISQKMTLKTKSAWHPALDKTANSLSRWMGDD